MIYYIKVDTNGYVQDMTALPTALVEYVAHDLAEMPKSDHMHGYYKIVDGHFIFCQEKYQEWLLAQPIEGEPTNE